MSTRDGDIDKIVEAERWGILRVFLIAALVTGSMSILLAGTIAGPVRKLSEAAERVRRGVKEREEIPDFSERKDEIGQLSQSLRDMTNTLYKRMDAIEAFAADVAHELKIRSHPCARQWKRCRWPRNPKHAKGWSASFCMMSADWIV